MLELEDKTPGEEKEEQEETVTASKSQPVDLNQGGKHITTDLPIVVSFVVQQIIIIVMNTGT